MSSSCNVCANARCARELGLCPTDEGSLMHLVKYRNRNVRRENVNLILQIYEDNRDAGNIGYSDIYKKKKKK